MRSTTMPVLALLLAATAGAATTGAATPLGAQDSTPRVTQELRPYVGIYLPTGALHGAFERATTLGTQGALELSRNFHVVGNVAWTFGHNKLAGLSSDVTYIWHYDVGVETSVVRPFGDWAFRPFLGIGGGGRTYDYRASDAPTRTATTGYAAFGTEFLSGMIGVRLEARDYLTGFKGPTSETSRTRSDLGFGLGLAYHTR